MQGEWDQDGIGSQRIARGGAMSCLLRGHECLGGHAVRNHARRTARLNMRLTPDALEMLREASRRAGVDVTTFVLDAALERCEGVLGGDSRMADSGAST